MSPPQSGNESAGMGPYRANKSTGEKHKIARSEWDARIFPLYFFSPLKDSHSLTLAASKSPPLNTVIPLS